MGPRQILYWPRGGTVRPLRVGESLPGPLVGSWDGDTLVLQQAEPRSMDHGALSGLDGNDHPQYLQKAGGTMTGPLTLAGNPTVAGEAINKAYADQIITDAGTVPKVTIAASAPPGPAVGDIWVQPT